MTIQNANTEVRLGKIINLNELEFETISETSNLAQKDAAKKATEIAAKKNYPAVIVMFSRNGKSAHFKMLATTAIKMSSKHPQFVESLSNNYVSVRSHLTA